MHLLMQMWALLGQSIHLVCVCFVIRVVLFCFCRSFRFGVCFFCTWLLWSQVISTAQLEESTEVKELTNYRVWGFRRNSRSTSLSWLTCKKLATHLMADFIVGYTQHNVCDGMGCTRSFTTGALHLSLDSNIQYMATEKFGHPWLSCYGDIINRCKHQSAPLLSCLLHRNSPLRI